MNQHNQQFIKAAVISTIVAGLLGGLTALAGGTELFTAKLFAVCLALILYGIAATMCLVTASKPDKQALGNAGMIVSALGFSITLIIILGEISDEGFLKLAFGLFIASIALAHICLLHNITLRNKYAHYARTTATIAITLFSLLLIVRIFEPVMSMYSALYNQSSLRMILAVLIIDLAATSLVPLCNRLETPAPVQELVTTTPDPEVPTSVEEQPPL